MIGERLADIRKDYNHTQADLALHIGVSLSAVRAWEQGKTSPSHEMLVAICKMYRVSSDYLLGLTDADPLYMQRKVSEKFTIEELESLKEYEQYLIWKRKKHSQGNGEK